MIGKILEFIFNVIAIILAFGILLALLLTIYAHIYEFLINGI